MTLRQAQDGRFGDAAVRLFGAAVTLLGWRPPEFWNATPAELAAALSPEAGAAEAPGREEIERLRALFPDQ